MPLRQDKAFLDIDGAARAGNLERRRTGQISGLPHRRPGAESDGIGQGNLHLGLLPEGAEEPHASDRALGPRDVDLLVGRELPGLR